MAITKLLLLLVAAIAQQYAFKAPNVRPPPEQLRQQRGAEYVVPYIVAIMSTLIWSWALLEGSVLFALSGYCPPALARLLLHPLLPTSLTSGPSPTALTSLTALTPTFLTGTIFTLTGTLLRAHCYNTLGPRFTFQLSIRPSHSLITQGVYGVIRHPSYTAVVAVVVGWLLCAFDPRGSVAAVCMGWLQASSGSGGGSGDANANANGKAMVTGVLACAWTTVLGAWYMVLSKRMNKEDAMLEKNFGEEWRAWARRVPCRLVPGVY